MNNNDNVINLFYVNEDYYQHSNSIISQLYIEGSWERFDWNFVKRQLERGKFITIRAANEIEMKHIEELMTKIGK